MTSVSMTPVTSVSISAGFQWNSQSSYHPHPHAAVYHDTPAFQNSLDKPVAECQTTPCSTAEGDDRGGDGDQMELISLLIGV